MASVIDVVFTGLMLICLDGEPNCPVGILGNTAWVVQADGKSMPCKSNDLTVTTLVLRFPKDAFILDGPLANECKEDEDDDKKIGCVLQSPPRDICVLPKPNPFGRPQQLDGNLDLLPSVDEVDLRFRALNMRTLRDPSHVPTHIHFPKGAIAAGAKWPPGQTPRLWSRSDNKADATLPRELSDRLKASYENADTLELTNCGVDTLLVLHRSPVRSGAEVEFLNRADKLGANVVGDYDQLAYLLWYYELGIWNTESGSCPAYTGDENGAAVLRCRRGPAGGCAFNGSPARTSTIWPPKRGPRPRSLK